MSECDHQSSLMRRPWPTRAVAHGKKKILMIRKVATCLSRDIITTRLKKNKRRNLSLSYLKEKFQEIFLLLALFFN